jgi:hypothetical protein
MTDIVRVRLNGENYRRAVKRSRGFTSTRIADRLDIRLDTLSHYVAGRRLMPYAQAVRVADLLNVDVTEIIDPDSVVCQGCGRTMEAA